MKRETGYYWVKLGGAWQSAFFVSDNNNWLLDGGVWEDQHFKEIN